MNRVVSVLASCAVLGAAEAVPGDRSAGIDLGAAIVVVRPGPKPAAEVAAANLLVEEIEERSGIRLPVRDTWPTEGRPVIALATRGGPAPWADEIGLRADAGEWSGPEGFCVHAEPGDAGRPARLFVVGADGRGVMYGVGHLLRRLRLAAQKIGLDAPLQVATRPRYAIRGHQLGYRARANSYDAWSAARYEEYIRDLIVFGANAVENIPFEDAALSPHMPLPRPEMNRRLSEICARYDIDYWIWTPADFPLTDAERRRAALREHEELYRSCPRLDGVFFPGGDPGDNPPEMVIPFLKDLAAILVAHHPAAKIWVSLQGFDAGRAERFYEFVEKEAPAWLGGLVAGPSSPPIGPTRLRLPRSYRLRWYPDIAHTVRCQFPVESWDPAFARTLGREPPNPRPSDYATIFRLYALYTDGFITYSDGINDDVNKAIWTMLGWDPDRGVREMLVEYARYFFGADVEEAAADALLGLEANWRGDLELNGAVNGTLALWQRLEADHPHLAGSWRFRMHLLRAYYDAYVRARLIREVQLEREAMAGLRRASEEDAGRAMDEALAVLRRGETDPVRPEWRQRIVDLADDLFRSIGYQTSVPRHHASGAERGCILDFLDLPMNNRWWLEDQFAAIRGLTDEAEKQSRLGVISTWDHPGLGSYYDDIGHVGRSPHVVAGEGANTDPELRCHDTADHAWWEEGRSRARLSWQTYLRWPVAVLYEGLDPSARYVVRLTGRGESRLRANGIALEPSRNPRAIGEFKEYPVPPPLSASGSLRLTWDDVDESHLNWRQQSHVAEVWLLRQPR